jgi:integrase/recombinase XerD
MNNDVIVYDEPQQTLIPRGATDDQVVELWLRKKTSEHTKRAYRSDIEALFLFTGKSLRETTMFDLQAYQESLTGGTNTQKRRLASVKSLFTFAAKSGYLRLNVGSATSLPKSKDGLAQRILTESQMLRLIEATYDNPRNHALLRLMYHTGMRVSEVVGLKWSDVIERDDGGQVTIFGKGEETRNVLISQDMYDELLSLRGFLESDEYVFQSRKAHKDENGNMVKCLIENQVNRIVSEAAHKAGIKGNVSPHWFRHAHASHSLDNHAPISLVQSTLGHKSLVTTSKYTHARPNASSSQFLKI